MSADIVPAEFDILVVGSGAAGLYATLSIPNGTKLRYSPYPD